MKKLTDQVSSYVETKALLDKYKKQEKEQRLKLLDRVFPSAGYGILNEQKGEWIIKGSFGLNYKLDLEMYEMLQETLSVEEFECIQMKPVLHAPTYKKLTDSQRVNLDLMVTITPALPTLSLKHIQED
jgi:hypothetical protein